MTKAKVFVAALVLMVGCASGLAQDAKSPEKPTVGGVLSKSLSNVEGEVVPAAEAMPEDKYSFAPTNGEFKGVRTFATQVKHLAAVNYMIGAAILAEKPPVEVGGENGPDAMTSKDDIVKFLKGSFAYLNKAVGSVSQKNMVSPVKGPFGDSSTTRLAMATMAATHCFDHYGQMVVYLRMNGIVPPASR